MTRRIGSLLLTLSLTFGAGYLAGELRSAEAGPTSGTVKIRVTRWPCAEDEPRLRGRGDFDGTRWARYDCQHHGR